MRRTNTIPDERDGDEGGIDIDLVPFYENELSQNGFQKATAAISAALQDDFKTNNKTNSSSHQDKPNKLVQQPDNDDVEMEEDCNDNATSENEEMKMDTAPVKQENNDVLLKPENIKKERMSHLPHPNEIKKERVSHIPEPVVESNESATTSTTDGEMNNEEPEQAKMVQEPEQAKMVPEVTIAAKVLPRKSNIRRSWNSPAVPKKQTPIRMRRSQPLRNSNKKVDYNETKKRKMTLSQSEEMSLTKKTKTEHLTKPETPSFLRKLRERGLKRGQSSESMQLRQIRELQKHTRTQVKQNDKNMRQALKALPYQPVRSMHVTKTKEFNFATDLRLKDHQMQTRSDVQKPFETQLRQHPPSPTFKKGPTKPKPFHFLLADKQPAPIQKQKWESMARSALNYQTKTPDRFRLKPKKDITSNEKEKKNTAVHVTHPKTPNLLTKSRARTVDVESAEERDAKEADAVKNYHFKASEFNPKIVEMQGMYGVKQIPEASTTRFKPFNFEMETRIQQRKDKEEINNHPETTATAKSKVNTSLPSKNERPRNTEVKPFSFANRDKQRYQKKEDKIKGVLQQEKEMHEFHARPLPSFSPDALPSVSTKAPTQPAPFSISSGSQAYQEKHKNKLLSEIEQDKANRQFKAQSADVVKHKPFKPLTGIIPPTCPDQVILNSDIRSKERAVFDQWKYEQEREMELLNLQRQKEKEEEEEKLVKQLRKDAVPKSNPVRQYRSIEIQKSAKALTTPMTPNFECKKRATMRL